MTARTQSPKVVLGVESSALSEMSTPTARLAELLGLERSVTWHPPDVPWRVTVSRTAQKNQRESMEDAARLKMTQTLCIGCICDGHYGKRAAHFVAKKMPKVVRAEITGAANSSVGFLRALLEHTAISARSSNDTRSSSSSCATNRMTEDSYDGRDTSAETLPALLSRCYAEVDAAFLEHAQAQEPPLPDGTTALLLLLDARTGLATVANAGDSRGVAAVDGAARPLSVDHNGRNDAERARIEALGGTVSAMGRVRGKLMVTRALGDLPYKQGLHEVICRPDVQSVAVDASLHFIVLACDGLWDQVSSVEAVQLVQRTLREPRGHAELAVRALAQCAIDRGSEDNISIMLFVFEHTRDGTVVPPPPEVPVVHSDDANSDDANSDDANESSGRAAAAVDVT